MIAFSLEFVNKNDDLYTYASFIPEINGYDTVVCHGSEYNVYIYNNDGDELSYTAMEFAERIKNSSSYSGKGIRLMSCNTGTKDDGFAQQLANIMNVNILAPSEAIWVNSYGEIFISDSDILAQMWYEGNDVNETGYWREFYPQKGAVND